ncbi:hypothetical protein [Kitasatospora sp. NPDC057198]|uniref:hypothetical protein n=1 Tax=Kitasatospora sp. NPDC057198 TaxID=3346046 RepID=UPI00362EA011
MRQHRAGAGGRRVVGGIRARLEQEKARERRYGPRPSRPAFLPPGRVGKTFLLLLPLLCLTVGVLCLQAGLAVRHGEGVPGVFVVTGHQDCFRCPDHVGDFVPDPPPLPAEPAPRITGVTPWDDLPVHEIEDRARAVYYHGTVYAPDGRAWVFGAVLTAIGGGTLLLCLAVAVRRLRRRRSLRAGPDGQTSPSSRARVPA